MLAGFVCCEPSTFIVMIWCGPSPSLPSTVSSVAFDHPTSESLVRPIGRTRTPRITARRPLAHAARSLREIWPITSRSRDGVRMTATTRAPSRATRSWTMEPGWWVSDGAVGTGEGRRGPAIDVDGQRLGLPVPQAVELGRLAGFGDHRLDVLDAVDVLLPEDEQVPGSDPERRAVGLPALDGLRVRGAVDLERRAVRGHLEVLDTRRLVQGPRQLGGEP